MNRVLSIKEIVPVFLVKPNAMYNLNGINIKLQVTKFRAIKTPSRQYPPLFYMECN